MLMKITKNINMASLPSPIKTEAIAAAIKINISGLISWLKMIFQILILTLSGSLFGPKAFRRCWASSWLSPSIEVSKIPRTSSASMVCHFFSKIASFSIIGIRLWSKQILPLQIHRYFPDPGCLKNAHFQ